jgi:hydrogenase maturation protease
MAIQKICILGLGNILMRDEGVGVHIANALRQKYSFQPEITIIDGGTTGNDLLPYFEQHNNILIIDAVEFGESPGFMGLIENENILTHLNTKLSLHHLGLSDVLSSMKLLGIQPDEVCLVGIQPKIMKVGLELSTTLSKKIPEIEKKVLTLLAKWGVVYSQKE